MESFQGFTEAKSTNSVNLADVVSIRIRQICNYQRARYCYIKHTNALVAIFVTVVTCHSQISHPDYLLLEITSDFRQCFVRCSQHEGCGSFKFSPQTAKCLGYLPGYEDEGPHQGGFQQYLLCRSRGCPAREHFVRLRGSGLCVRVSDEMMGWESARNICRRQHSDLVVINTRKKARSIKRYIHNMGPHVKNEDYKWVGMRRQPSSRRYKWVHGRSTWGPWYPGDPSYGPEMCVFFHTKKGIADVRCHEKKHFICEIMKKKYRNTDF